MSIYRRFINVLRAIASVFVSDMEKQNPDGVYQNAIDSATQRFIKARSAVASILSQRQQVADGLETRNAVRAQAASDLEAALDTDQDDLAELLVQKLEQLDAEIAGLTADLTRLTTESDQAKGILTQLKGEIDRLKSEKTTMLSRKATAEARLSVQNQLDGLNVDAELKALETVREDINSTVAQANLSAEMAGTDVDHRLGQLRQTSKAKSAKDRVAQMKAARVEAQSKSM